MAVPTIDTITPALGLAWGGDYLLIKGEHFRLPTVPATGYVGGVPERTVQVLIGGEEAEHVEVADDPDNLPDGTLLYCSSPRFRGQPEDMVTPSFQAPVDVVIRNLDPSTGDPVPGEEVTEVDGFSYHRPDLANAADFTRLVEEVIASLRRQVLDNVAITTSIDFDSDPASGLNITELADLPALILVGPSTDDDPEYETDEELEVEQPDGSCEIRRPVRTVDLVFTLFGATENPMQILNLFKACRDFFDRNLWIEIDRDPDDLSAGRVRWEMDITTPFAMATEPNNSDVHLFTGGFTIKGFDIHEGVVVGIGYEIAEEDLQLTRL